MSEIINNNDSYIVRTNGRIYVKQGGRYIALIDEDGNLNVKLKTSISTVSNFNDINSEGLYYYNGNIYAYANGSPYLLTGGGGSGDVINQVLSGDLRAVTSNAVYVTTENIKNNLANKVLPFEEFKTISSVVYNPTDITEGRVLYSLNLKCFILENTVGGRTTYYTNWRGSEKYQTINSENVSQITPKPDVLYLFTNLNAGQVNARTLYMAKSSGDLTRVLTDRDLNNVLTLDDIDTEITSSSSKPVASSAIYTALSKLGSIEYFDGTLSAEETINIIDSATTSNDIQILYSYKYKTFVAKYNNNYYKRWNTADKFFDGTTPNKHILFVCDDTLYFWNNDLVTVNVDNIDDCIIYVDLYMRGGQLPTPSASDLGKYAIVESNTYQLYRAEQFNNVISYTAKSFSKNRLYINDNKLYLWNGSELVQVGISEFNLQIAPFDGVINSATVQESTYTGTGDIFYITSLQRFAFRVISLNQTKYYNNWSDSGLYFGENRKPRKDTIYVNNGVGYVFDGTNGLVAIGGSTPSGPDTQQTVDQSLSTTSTNAVSNKAVTTELNDLSGRVTTMEQSGVPSEVTADEITVSAKNTTGGNAAIHLASNPKSTVNSVGAIHVTDSVLPSNVSQNTKYIIYKDITTGNVDGQNYIQLASGTKIVPNGGIPKVPVVGGEMSWVHSSDIGMIQDDGTHNSTIGKQNFNILKSLVQSQYNLILDGEYYVESPLIRKSSSGWALKDECFLLINRPFEIQNGTLYLNDGFMLITDGGSFRATNVRFIKIENEHSTAPIRIKPTNSLIDHLEFINCFMSAKIGSGYASSGFVGNSTDEYIAPMDAVRKWSEYYLESLNLPNSLRIADSDQGDNIFIFPVDCTVDKTAKTVTYTYEDGGVQKTRTLSKVSDLTSYAVEFHKGAVPVYVVDENGDYFFIRNSQTMRTKLDGYYGYYIRESLVSEEELENSDGNKYSQLSGTDPGYTQVENFGIKSLKFINCRIDGANINLSDMTIQEGEIYSCRVSSVSASSFNFSTTNTKLYAGDWTHRSGTIIVQGCSFEGVDYVIGQSSGTYTTPLMMEVNQLIVKNCEFKNIYSACVTYDIYANINSLLFENNYEYNVLRVPYSASATNYNEFFKSKGVAERDGRLGERIIRNNWFEVNGATAWLVCKSYMENLYGENAKSFFEDFALSKKILQFVGADPVIDKISIENNTFKFDGPWAQSPLSDRAGNICDLTIKNNVFFFKKFTQSIASPIGVYRAPKRRQNNIDIEGNIFNSKEPSIIQIATTANNDFILDKVNIVNNTFNNCTFQLNNYDGGTVRLPISIGSIIVKGNNVNCPNGTFSEVTHKKDIVLTSKLYIYGELHRYKTSFNSSVELVDYQVGNNEATCPKVVDFTDFNGNLTVRSPHLNRPIAFIDGSNITDGKYYTVYKEDNKTVDYTYRGDNKSLVFVGLGVVNQSYVLTINYTYKGVNYKKRMEILHEFEEDVIDGATKRVDPAFVVRDVKGIAHKFEGGEDNTGDMTFTFDDLEPLNDIGLGFHVEGYGQTKGVYTQKLSNYKANSEELGFICLHVYTLLPEGTKNDEGTDITIEVKKISNNASFRHFSYAKLPGDQSNFSSLRTFIENGEEVTSNWISKTSEGFNWQYYTHIAYCNPNVTTYRVAPYVNSVTTPYIRPEDAGLRVHVGKQWYTCDGTQWIPDKTVVSLTQSAYDALTTKDENTLYLIVDA